MSDTKISLLTELAAADINSAADFLAIVDTSGNETKKIKPSSLFAGRGQKGTKSVSAAGIETVTLPIAELAATYNILCAYVMSSVGKVEAIPQIPPLTTDSRTTTTFDVEVFDAGTLYWAIL